MAAAKKGKKNKGKTLALIDFLQETPGTVSTMPIRKSTMNWADEVEDNHDVYDSRSSKTSVILPTAPKASRDFDDISDKVPQDPPYIAYLSNLPYDVDESEISAFFKNLKIANMRIPRDERAGEMPKLRGFGYVEFEDRESLLNALVIPDTTIKNRRIRIDVASENDDKRRQGGRMDMNRDRGGRSDVSMGDWRSGPRQESSEGGDRRGGFSREKERDSDTSGPWRGSRDSNRDSDRGGFSRDSNRDSDRGGFSRDSNRDSDRGFGRSDRFRDDREQDYGRPRDDSRFMNRDRRFEDRGSRNGGGFTRNPPPPREEPETNRNEPRQRPKLILTPRTKPVENEPEKVSSSTAIFGNAKPVDTSARERQIEERLLAKDNEPSPPKRELSRERRDTDQERDDVSQKDYVKEKEKPAEIEKKSVVEIEKSELAHSKSDANGVLDKSHQQKKNGDHEKKDSGGKSDGGEKQKSEVKRRDEKKEKPEKEMPKLKKQEPPNFIASNKFAYLQTEDNSD